MTIIEIKSAIKSELDATPEYFEFKVKHAEREENLWRVSLQPGSGHAEGHSARSVLDDSFEGSTAWWPEPDKGSADVLVVPEEDQIILQDATAKLPGKDQIIRLYPPRYLDGLLACWRDDDWAQIAFESLDNLSAPTVVPNNALSGHSFRWLRKAQRDALKLVGYSSGFLWGPPGTGKTTCLGVILAEYLYLNPRSRVLMLSSTNHAVDLTMVSLDKALEETKRDSLRTAIKRIGTRFIASNYKDREHLLPVLDRDLIARLAQLERARPPSSGESFIIWAKQIDELRKFLRKLIYDETANARLVGMTTTRAIFDLGNLRQLPKFDLIVFDEASQVGLAHALALMPLGKSRLFAGDPQQLSPVVRSDAKEAQRWLARTAFAEKTEKPRQRNESVCMLDEQSRMADPICRVVSNVFYDGKLRVAKDASDDENWTRDRRLVFGPIDEAEHVSIQNIAEEGTWSKLYQGPIRYRSAEMIADLLAHASRTPNGLRDTIVLTPFRSQRAFLKKRLNSPELRSVKISTVHRSQGSEASVVIFDPVDGGSKFLNSEEAKRLINVAFSRAKAKLIVLLSANDLKNPIFSRLNNIVNLDAGRGTETPIADFIERPDFPKNAVGHRVSINTIVGIVTSISKDDQFLILTDAQNGIERRFKVQTLRDNAVRP